MGARALSAGPVVAAAVSGVLVGAAIVATRFVIVQTTPASLALLRYAIGFLCLLPLVAVAGLVPFARKDILPIAALGIAQFGILIALLNLGLESVPSGRAALIFASFPLLTMLIAAAFGREPLTPSKSAGVLTTILGVALTLGEKALAGAATFGGELAIFASALCGAICSVLYRPYLTRYPTLQVSAFAMLASVGFLAILAAGEGFFAHPPTITTTGWLAIAFIGVASAVGYVSWLWALREIAPTRTTVFIALSPITATLLGAALLSEPITPLAGAGVAAVALGLWLAQR